MIKDITCEEQGLVTLLDGFKHTFEDGDEIQLQKVEGMTTKNEQEQDVSINGTIHKIITVTPTSFKIGDTRNYTPYQSSGLAKQMKTKKLLEFKALRDVQWSEIPFDLNLMISDFEKMDHNNWSHYCYEIIDQIKEAGKYVTAQNWHDNAFGEFIDTFEKQMKKCLTKEQAKDLTNNKKFERFTSAYCVVNNGVFNPLCAFIGGVVSQEAIKAITHKFVPIHQFFYYDAIEIIPHFRIDTVTHFEEDMKELGYINNTDDRYTGLRACIGNHLLDKIHQANLFMIGAGAIGCELLKNYAMIGAGSKDEGSIIVTDPDVIEISNLNRQFLFREKHLRKPKSVTAAAAAIHMNPDMKGKIIARLDKIHRDTETTYSQKFYKSLSMVTNALDNVTARRYLDAQCVKARIPMIDSGTLGPKGHVQVVIPSKTESYSSTNDPEDTTEIPHCTLKMFPEEALHCVEWGRDLFGQLFNQRPKSFNKLISDFEVFDPNDSEQKKIAKDALALIENRPTDFESCLKWARLYFNQLYVLDVKQLLHAYPLDQKTKEGKPFWSLPKRAPTELEFDRDSELHAKFIAACACLRAVVFNIEIPYENPRSPESIKAIAYAASAYGGDCPEFKPNQSELKIIKAAVDQQNKDTQQEEEETIETGDEDWHRINEDVILPLKKEYFDMLSDPEGLQFILLKPQEFEKDNDANFHIDFIYAVSMCRAESYSLDKMDWITTKIKAGKIIPALATTTSAIAGLQTLEMIKILNDTKLTDMRNAFLNLAVPSMMASEPGAPEKKRLKEGLEVDIWDVWTVHFPKIAKISDLLKKAEKKFGLDPRDIIKDGLPVFLYALDNAIDTGKKDKSLAEAFNVQESQDEVEITITFADPEEKGKILEGVPPIVIKFT